MAPDSGNQLQRSGVGLDMWYVLELLVELLFWTTVDRSSRRSPVQGLGLSEEMYKKQDRLQSGPAVS